ncbi:hypothetical protein GQ457_04G031050 [Hibiscus cannabinus]
MLTSDTYVFYELNSYTTYIVRTSNYLKTRSVLVYLVRNVAVGENFVANVTDVDLKHVSCAGIEYAAKEIASGSLKAKEATVLDVPYDIGVSLARDIGGDWDIDYELGIGLTQ